MSSSFARGSNQYVKRYKITADDPGQLDLSSTISPSASTGLVSWSPSQMRLDRIQFQGVERALARFEHVLPKHIWNATALENNVLTLPEVRTILEGRTVGGRPIQDQQQVQDLHDAVQVMVSAVSDGSFVLSKEMSNKINAKAVAHEALDAGCFRGEGSVRSGGGDVRLTDGEVIDAVPTERLGRLWTRLLATTAEIDDPRERALVFFAGAVRLQPYQDGNKRTARLMMAGELLSHGFDAISVPVARRLEWNIGLEDLFRRDDADRLLSFLVDCAPTS